MVGLAQHSLRPPPPMISIVGLATQFRNHRIHNNLDLEILTGEVLVLLGGSGSGKSTLLRTLVGLESPVAGRCIFSDVDLFQLSESDWIPYRQRIAYVFQGGALFDSLTVGENLHYPLQAHMSISTGDSLDKISTILTSLGLPGIEDLLPSALSGGMQKRVGLARALMLEPEVVLYDEPTAGLDPANSRMIAQTIKTLQAQGKTSVLVTHDTQCALAVANRLALIAEGKIVALQIIEDFRRSPDQLLADFIEGENKS